MACDEPGTENDRPVEREHHENGVAVGRSVLTAQMRRSRNSCFEDIAANAKQETSCRGGQIQHPIHQLGKPENKLVS
jgi:hypothetical protein